MIMEEEAKVVGLINGVVAKPVFIMATILGFLIFFTAVAIIGFVASGVALAIPFVLGETTIEQWASQVFDLRYIILVISLVGGILGALASAYVISRP